MAARLIINADDFGLTRGINRAIEELYQAGTLSSATLMANGPAFDDAVAISHSNPGLGVGCHVVLTDGIPTAPLDEIPTLLGPDRKSFRPDLSSFLLDLVRGKISEAEVFHESLCQISKLQRAGITVTHVDTHKHTHIWPPVARAVVGAAYAAKVSAIRNPFEPPWSLALGNSKLVRNLQVRLMRYLQPRFLALPQIRDGLVRTTDGTIGISATGNLNADTLRRVLDAMPDGLWELVCHPGYNDADLGRIVTRLRSHREIEYHALLSQISQRKAQPNAPELIHYSALAEPSISVS
ncbi:ChbG/HpnK family deacetylase [Granulicella sp. 5B5]|uniref:ChbG/HpnK family deacetylase n=1 Tax=Granulicella sp. 5B5 TaxID=1617967 RepID=UPI0015F480C9|nr:ChbG/HpnK family deacetylase [Granulicella sp. 5B5]QMV20076.1 ChbG/HpnK family deacetylase [Granulicella sp. 5B5]